MQSTLKMMDRSHIAWRKTLRRIPALGLLWIGITAWGGPTEDVAWSQMNDVFQAPLFSEKSLWDEDVARVGKRLRWPLESRTSTLSSYRLYPSQSVNVLGTRPYSLVLYGENGKPAEVSMIFANKGDFEGFALGRLKRVTPTRETLRDFKAALASDESKIEERLRAVLGEPVRLTYGERNLKEKSLRWDWMGHAILLAAPRGEYVGVRVVPVDQADQRGRLVRISDTELKQQLAKNVRCRPNGDVIVTEIPMVDQGPKGYCVPATWERYLRYLGLSADMYVLAMIGDTMTGGGTRLDLIVEGIRSYVSRAGRRVTNTRINLTPMGLQKYIDRGVPVMWVMRTSEALASMFSTRAANRERATDWAQWKESLKDARRGAKRTIGGLDTGYHMCLLIGYNKDTSELCFTDSWGSNYAERWITVEEAQAMSEGDFLVITW